MVVEPKKLLRLRQDISEWLVRGTKQLHFSIQQAVTAQNGRELSVELAGPDWQR